MIGVGLLRQIKSSKNHTRDIRLEKHVEAM